jgi:hypothetical protein
MYNIVQPRLYQHTSTMPQPHSPHCPKKPRVNLYLSISIWPYPLK